MPIDSQAEQQWPKLPTTYRKVTRKHARLSGHGCRTGRVRIIRCISLAACVLTLGMGCRASVAPPLPNPVPGTMTFKVVASPGGEPLSNVVVTAANRTGLHRMGETNRFGVFVTSTQRLRELEPHALLFCHRDFFCGAIVDGVTPATETEDRFIGLALFMTP